MLHVARKHSTCSSGRAGFTSFGIQFEGVSELRVADCTAGVHLVKPGRMHHDEEPLDSEPTRNSEAVRLAVVLLWYQILSGQNLVMLVWYQTKLDQIIYKQVLLDISKPLRLYRVLLKV